MSGALLCITLLGAFHLTYGDTPVAGFDQARLQQLLAYLLLHRGKPVSRQQLAFLFWTDSTEEQARTNLRNLWHRLRHSLPEADRFLSAGELAVQWQPDAPWQLDVADFETELVQANAALQPEQRIAHLEQAIVLYQGELLPGCYAEWILAERERLAQAYARALEQLANLEEDRRNYPAAIAAIQAVLRHDPLREPAYAQLMRLHALNDDRAAALHTYHTCATVLSRELDAEPGRATRELYEQLLHATPLPAPQPQLEATTPLVGREGEWQTLQRAWREAALKPRLVLLTGETGIGKTRMAEALVEWVNRQGIPAFTSRCYATQGELAYAPIVGWLRAQSRPRLPEPWLRELARFLPEVLAEHPDLPPPEPLSESWQRLRLFEALSRALLSGSRALLLFLDDLQWCDQDTLDWLDFLLGSCGESGARVRLLVVTTLKTEGEEATTALEAWRATLLRRNQLVEIALGPLNEEATLALADRVGGKPFDRALASLFFQGTEGNPLFIVEMLRASFARTVAAPAQHAAAMLATYTTLPERVHRVLQARLAQLSPPARGMLDLASVIGRAFTYEVLLSAADLSEDALIACLDECWRKRIIREQGNTAYDFSHALLREVAYTDLSHTRRRWLHGRVAHALETVYAADLDAIAGMLAGHYAVAGQPEQAIDCYERAAKAARDLHAHNDALSALEKALALQEALPPASRCRLAAPLYEQLGDQHAFLAHHQLARDAYGEGLARVEAAATVARARLLRKLGKTLENERAGYDQVAEQYAAAEALLGAPEAEAGPAWWEEWCQIQLEHLMLLYWWGRPERMAEQLSRVRPLIEQHGTPLQRAALFSNLCRHLNQQCRYAPSDVALGYAQAALAALPASAPPELRAPYQFVLGFSLLWHGDLAEAETALRMALEMAELTGDVTLQARCLVYCTVVYRRQGRVPEVEATAHRGLAVAESAGMLDYIGASDANLAWGAWQRGDLEAAEVLARTALEAWQRHPAPYPLRWQALWPLVGVSLLQARLDVTISYIQQLLDPTQQLLSPAIEQPLAAALAAWDAGQPTATRDLLAQVLDLAQQLHLS